MIIVELIEGNTKFRRYSDRGVKIRCTDTGVCFDDAVDFTYAQRAYEETDIPAEGDISDAEALRIITGGVEDEI